MPGNRQFKCTVSWASKPTACCCAIQVTNVPPAVCTACVWLQPGTMCDTVPTSTDNIMIDVTIHVNRCWLSRP